MTAKDKLKNSLLIFGVRQKAQNVAPSSELVIDNSKECLEWVYQSESGKTAVKNDQTKERKKGVSPH
ncbi:MAG: hypothetical protein WCX84_04515 [Syntrophales bacterium]|nr:hypothetical protein [Syntrophales bacterium]